MFDAEFIDPRDLQPLLLTRLQYEYNEHQGMDLSEQGLACALNLILATFPRLVRDASRVCSARFKQVFDADVLPPFILKTAVEYIPTNKNQHKLDKESCVMLSV